MASNQLMKFTGDLKALPFRELRSFANELSTRLSTAGMAISDNDLCDLLVATAETLNPDDPKAAAKPGGWDGQR